MKSVEEFEGGEGLEEREGEGRRREARRKKKRRSLGRIVVWRWFLLFWFFCWSVGFFEWVMMEGGGRIMEG